MVLKLKSKLIKPIIINIKTNNVPFLMPSIYPFFSHFFPLVYPIIKNNKIVEIMLNIFVIDLDTPKEFNKDRIITIIKITIKNIK